MTGVVKLADYVASFLADKGADTVFAISGGASLHLIHAVADSAKLRLVCPHHEQAAAMAADAYARVKGAFGIAIATSGPGATNLITGICCSYYDSVPVFILTGQVSTFRSVGKTNVRQIGFQETPIVEMVRPVTKYAVTLSDPLDIRFELEKAFHFMTEGRPGPVVVDVPDNFQRALIDPDSLRPFLPEPLQKASFQRARTYRDAMLEMIRGAERPVLVAGWGVHLAGCEEAFKRFAEALGIPVALTWGGADLLEAAHPLNIGRFGTHGMRGSNICLQHADLIIAVGTRLDTKSTGTPVKSFAPKAKKIVVDIDPFELGKFKTFDLHIDLPIQEDLKSFFNAFELETLRQTRKDLSLWKKAILMIVDLTQAFDNQHRNSIDGVNPYYFLDNLSRAVAEQTVIITDTGCALAWIMQAWQITDRVRVFHDFNNTAMGWSLPAVLGSYFADRSKPLICIVGDGSIMMSIQELATIAHHKIPVKIFIVNNGGYAMIRQTQDQWLESNYVASSNKGGLSFPNFSKVASAFGFSFAKIDRESNIGSIVNQVMSSPQKTICEVVIPDVARVVPQVKHGKTNEFMEPKLDDFIYEDLLKIIYPSEGC